MRTLADYTANDVTPEDHPNYAKHVDQWQIELHPKGALECYFAAEIVRAAWRMERYAVFETLDVNDPARTAGHESKMLRYRDQTNLGIRRNLEELRRLQSDRYLQAHLGILLPGVGSLKLVLPGLKQTKQHHEQGPDSKIPAATPSEADIQRSEAILDAQIKDEERRQLEEFRKNNPDPDPDPALALAPAPLSPKPEATRNAICPCGSGQKYKRCCGHWSKSPLPKAA